ncbi:MAG TPA: polysaccharide biosynthesis/export family protein [Longimicrobiales bacterium]|nr:polysaccharide biosynthesis/export family protein [Longimicrobiales bacterium]
MRDRIRLRTATLLTAALLLAVAGPLQGQDTAWMPTAPEVTRQELLDLLTQLEATAGDPSENGTARENARREAEFVRYRLRNGDFQAGDRIVLYVQGEPTLSDTMGVTAAQTVQVPEIGDISLNGVLRSELQQHMQAEINRYVRNAEVRTTPLIRLAVLGAVTAPGFYTVPAGTLLEEALMLAGGPAGNADVEGLEIHRGDHVIWEGDFLQQAMIAGRTLDQLSIQAGDRIVVPEDQPGFFQDGVVQTLLFTVPTAVYLILRVVGDR